MFGGMFGAPMPGGVFEATYRCYPVSFIDKPQMENGDKVIMPPSALDRLASLRIDYPMLFNVLNLKERRSTHCGVLEFIADEGMIYMPYWMMQNLLLTEGDVIKIKSVSLPKGTFVKLQPHTQDFLDISNPKAVLETTLRNFTCLSVGDTILVNYNSKRFYIDIIEAKPGEAISIVETDCEVDFAPPLDYVEPVYKPAAAAAAAAAVPAGGAAGGAAGADGAAAGGAEPEPEPEEPKFLPFRGSGNRLDGKPVDAPPILPLSASRSSLASSSAGGLSQASTAGATAGSSRPGSSQGGAPKAGKLVFGGGRGGGGGGGGAAPAGGSGSPAGGAPTTGPGGVIKPPPRVKPGQEPPKKAEAEEPKKEEEPKFVAFQGKGNKLK